MKPDLAVVADINIALVRRLDFFTGCRIEVEDRPCSVIPSHKPKLGFLLPLLLSLIPSIAQATTIILYWTRDRIVIGADSKRKLPGGGFDEVCKINESNRIFFVLDGFTGDTDGFDARAIARQSSTLSGGSIQ